MYKLILPAACRVQRYWSCNAAAFVKWESSLLNKSRLWCQGTANCVYYSLTSCDLSHPVLEAYTVKRYKSTLPERVVDSMPNRLQPYLRLTRVDKPTGTWLLLWPCYWSLAMASAPGSFPDPLLLGLFGSGAFLMRGAGCIINDLWDRDLDSKVFRTRHRPLCTGELSTLDAVMLLGGQLSVSLFVLLQLNWYTIVLGSSSLFLVVVYPLMKRVFDYPQLVLGLTFNWGALLGWSAVTGYCDWAVVLPLYGACIFWTMIYDTIYAHQDKTDDLLINIKSTALKFGENTKLWLGAFGAGSTACFLTSGYLHGQTWPYYTSIGIAALMFAKQAYTVNIHDTEDCFKKFKYNQKLGWVIFLGIVCGTLFKQAPEKARILSERDFKPDCLDAAPFQLT